MQNKIKVLYSDMDMQYSLFETYKRLKDDLSTVTDAGDIEALHVLRHVAAIKREDLIINKNIILPSDQVYKINQILAKRLSGQPLSNILGVKEFWGRDFKTTSDTLDPRADSETLIRAVQDFIPDQKTSLNILDIGTGTGCLAITLLKEFPNAHALAIDISEPALKVAKENAHNLEVTQRISFECKGWNDIKTHILFDIIISNPPYISYAEKPDLDAEVLNYDPHLALFADNSGLRAYQELAQITPGILKDSGALFLEIGQAQAQDVTFIFQDNGFSKTALYKDLAGRDRCLVFEKN